MKEKRQTGYIIIIIALILIILGLIFYILFFQDEKVISQKNQNNSSIEKEVNDNVQEEQKKEESNSISNAKSTVCTGTYYGETQGTFPNGIEYDYKYQYILNSDGTFTAKINEISKLGVYVINDNTISLISQKSTTGPRNEDPYYKTSDYVIADDCSYIIINDDNISFNLMKQ